ncbi:MAG: hypothetical protein ACRDJU_00190 [Actinomycetota bacterium]
MFAQLTHLQGSPDKLADTIKAYYTDTITAFGGQAGFSGGYLMADRASGRLIVVATWSSEADMKSAEGPLAPVIAQLMRAAGVQDSPSTQRFEVIGQASGNLTARPT